MTAPLLHPVIPAASERQETAPEAQSTLPGVKSTPDAYLDLDFLDSHKIATDPRFAVRDGLNARRW